MCHMGLYKFEFEFLKILSPKPPFHHPTTLKSLRTPPALGKAKLVLRGCASWLFCMGGAESFEIQSKKKRDADVLCLIPGSDEHEQCFNRGPGGGPGVARGCDFEERAEGEGGGISYSPRCLSA